MDTGKVLCLDVSDRDIRIQQALAEVRVWLFLILQLRSILTPLSFQLVSIEGLASYRSPRFWPKDASSLIGSIHIQLAPSASSFDPTGPHSNLQTTYVKLDRVVERVDSLLRRRIFGLEELTIQVEEMNLGQS
jgi:zinc transporter 5/7